MVVCFVIRKIALLIVFKLASSGKLRFYRVSNKKFSFKSAKEDSKDSHKTTRTEEDNIFETKVQHFVRNTNQIQPILRTCTGRNMS